jgi:hypothetical protein
MLRKVGVQLDVEQQNQIKNAARDAVLAVEEQNRRNVKGGLDPMTSKQKDTAATFIVSQTRAEGRTPTRSRSPSRRRCRKCARSRRRRRPC